MIKQLASVFLVLLAFSGCAWFSGPKTEKTAKELIDEGMADFNDEDYQEAIESFEKLKDWYPFSKYAVLAELKIADAYFNIEEYEEAVFAYEEFENLHPRNEAIPYVIYRIGRCYFDRMDTPDRDQTFAHRTVDTFNRLIKQHPKSEQAGNAREHIAQSRRSLAEHEVYVGVFYLKSKHYKAALHRFLNAETEYSDTGIREKTRPYIAECKMRLAEEENLKNKP